MNQQFPRGALVRVFNRSDKWNDTVGRIQDFDGTVYYLYVKDCPIRSYIGQVACFIYSEVKLEHPNGQSNRESNPPSSSETVQQSNSETKRIIRPKCPACGLEHEKNYVGFQVIECQNWQCKWFKS